MNVKPLIIAHRGYSSKFPENTWDAFNGALSAGADIIELDLVLTSDRKIFVNHDLHINGVPVRSMDLSTALSLVPGSMELTDVLEWAIDKRTGLYLDIKDRAMIGELTSVIKDAGDIEIVVSSSDDFPFMRKLKEMNDNILTALLFRNLLPAEDMIEIALRYGGDIIHPCWEDKDPFPSSLISPEDVEMMEGEGFRVVCWHEEREEELKRLSKKGFWGITTNDPSLLRKILHETT
jgi:glycerophosphoryl diester phosphodiesterase